MTIQFLALVVTTWLMGLNVHAQAQQFDLLIKGGRVIDPRNQIDSVLDVAIAGGKIARVAADIAADQAIQVVDAGGLIVAPGLIDIHVHAFFGTDPDGSYGGGLNSLPPDGFTLRSGVTTAVDVGSSGWRNIHDHKEREIDHSNNCPLAYLNMMDLCMSGDPSKQCQTAEDQRYRA